MCLLNQIGLLALVEVVNSIFESGWMQLVATYALVTCLVDVVIFPFKLGLALQARLVMGYVLVTCLVEVELYINKIEPCMVAVVNDHIMSLVLRLYILTIKKLPAELFGTMVGRESEGESHQQRGSRAEVLAMQRLNCLSCCEWLVLCSLVIGFIYVEQSCRTCRAWQVAGGIKIRQALSHYTDWKQATPLQWAQIDPKSLTT